MQQNDLINIDILKQMPGFFGILSLKSDFLLVNNNGSNWTGFKSPDFMIGLSYCYSNSDWKIILGEKYLIKNKINEAVGIVTGYVSFLLIVHEKP